MPKRGSRSKSGKMGKKRGMGKNQSVFHDINKKERGRMEESDPYYMEDTEGER